VFSTVYVSTSTVPFWDAEIAALLAQSRENNTKLDLTGILLFKNGQFMQALEGPEKTVRSLIETISKDPRHTDVRILSEEEIEVRQFPSWTMGYRGVTDRSITEIPGYDKFFETAAGGTSSWATPSRARFLLDWFRTNKV
jgi:hypothetical protein